MVAQTGLVFVILLPHLPRVLRLQACITMRGYDCNFLEKVPDQLCHHLMLLYSFTWSIFWGTPPRFCSCSRQRQHLWKKTIMQSLLIETFRQELESGSFFLQLGDLIKPCFLPPDVLNGKRGCELYCNLSVFFKTSPCLKSRV